MSFAVTERCACGWHRKWDCPQCNKQALKAAGVEIGSAYGQIRYYLPDGKATDYSGAVRWLKSKEGTQTC